MVSDGIMPSNEGRGYVLRRLLRRAARHGRMLGIDHAFLAGLSKKVIEVSKDGYPELIEKAEFIYKVISEEEEKFNRTIDQGLSILAELESGMKDGEKLSGEEAFRLYDTFGFPLDLTKEILQEKGFGVDEKAFMDCMQKQRETARAARKKTNYMGADVTVYQSIDPAVTSEFVGYENEEYESEILVLTTEDEIVEALSDGQSGTIITAKTPFYATSGGQNADNGVISLGESEFAVEDVIKLQGGKIGHVGHVTSGMFKTGDKVTLSINKARRAATAKNHSATHLLQKALRMVLGNHVEQAGSYVDDARLRFDFTHFSAMTPDEIARVEQIVNDEIAADLAVSTEIMSIEDAKKSGAMALFGEKYGDSVRVVSMGDFSKELCGGTHVSNTGSIAAFKIISEAGVSAGVRRIEALTSKGLLAHYEEIERKYNALAALTKTVPDALEARITALLGEVKALSSENEKLKNEKAKDSLGDVMNSVVDIKGVKFLAAAVPGVEMNELRNLGDSLKEKLGEGVIVLASDAGGKVNLIAMASDEAMARGVHAGNLIREIAPLVGGGGGGRPNMAQAGGKNPAGISDALKKAAEAALAQIK